MRNLYFATAAFAALGLAACGESEPTGPTAMPDGSYEGSVETIEEDPQTLQDSPQDPAPLSDEMQPPPNDVPGMPGDTMPPVGTPPSPGDILPPTVDEPPPPVDILPPIDEDMPEGEMQDELPDSGVPAPETGDDWPGPQ